MIIRPFSPILISIGQVLAMILFLLYEEPHAYERRPDRIGLTILFFLVHAAMQTLLHSDVYPRSTGSLPTLPYFGITMFYYIVFVRLWTGCLLPVCSFTALIFLLVDNCVWPLLSSLSRQIWGISYLYEGDYLLRLPFILLLWILESGIMLLIRRVMPSLSRIRLDRYNVILTLASVIPFLYIRVFSSQFQQKLRDIDSVNRKYHDMKNILLCLEAQGGSESVHDEIQKILTEIQPYETLVVTGNEAIDIVLNEKLSECQKKEITCVPYLDGHMLDFAEPLDLRGGLPVTTKADAQNHGYGLGNIRYLMDKYHGELNCRVENQEFLLTLLFVNPPQ